MVARISPVETNECTADWANVKTRNFLALNMVEISLNLASSSHMCRNYSHVNGATLDHVNNNYNDVIS